MRRRSVRCANPGGHHSMAYVEWGPVRSERTVVCAHGLTRNARDFDWLAQALAERGWRVVCPDVAGRGQSDRLGNGMLYGYPQYVADMNTLLARLDCGQVDWIGTSMGGLIGMMLAAEKGSLVRSLVMNDVGPLVPAEALRRIGSYVGKQERFPDLAAAEAHFRTVHAPFGPLSDEQWAHLTRHSVRPAEGGGFEPGYDLAIGDAFKTPISQDIDLWALWDKVSCPVMVVRGAESDLLQPRTLERMTDREAETQTLTVPGCGHAPALMSDEQIEPIVEFVSRQPLGDPWRLPAGWSDGMPPLREKWPWKGGHLQTVRNRVRKPGVARLGECETLEFPMPDGTGDRLTGSLSAPADGTGRPLALLVHGLTGCEESRYLVDQAVALRAHGFPVLRLNLRGAGPARRLCRFQYHAGRSEDIRHVLAGLDPALTNNGVVAVGFSLGGNTLLKLLGEDGRDSPLRGAVTVCAPLDLGATQRSIALPRNRAYQRYFVTRMVEEALTPISAVDEAERQRLKGVRTVYEFDNRFVAPRNGFGDAPNYYETCSSEHFLGHIGCPTLVMTAANDPIVPVEPYRRQVWGRNPLLVPMLTERGGHCGYHAPGLDWPWSAEAAARFLAGLAG